MQILSVNIASAQPIASKSGQTGIFKHPQSGAVRITKLGLQGDAILDTQHHGGRDQAVYLYGQPDYDWWENELGRKLPAGTFGENLTLSDFESANFHIGDQLLIGEVILEFTSPRIPCETFAVRMQDPKFAKTFFAAKRPGIYCRVIQTGAIQAGEQVKFVPYQGVQVKVNELLNYKNPTPEQKERFLKTPIHHKTRTAYQSNL